MTTRSRAAGAVLTLMVAWVVAARLQPVLLAFQALPLL